MAKKKNTKKEEFIFESGTTLQNKVLDYKVSLKCKNEKQKEFLKLLKDKKKDICFGIGSAGTGKSYLSLAYSLHLLKDSDNKYKKIIIVPPTCEAGSISLSLGYLKGDLQAKVQPYLDADSYTIEKILDKSGNENAKKITNKLFEDGYVEYQLVNFARGKNYDDCILLINECENYNKEEMLLLLTRIGENCKVIATGDPQQKDRKDLKKFQDGLSFAYAALGDLEEVGGVVFSKEDIVRNPLISKIIDRFS